MTDPHPGFSSWLNQPSHLKKYSSNWDHFPNFRDEHKKYLMFLAPIIVPKVRQDGTFANLSICPTGGVASPQGPFGSPFRLATPLGGPTICCWSIRPHIRRHKIPKTHLAALLAFGIDASGVHTTNPPTQRNNPKNTPKRGTLSPFLLDPWDWYGIFTYTWLNPWILAIHGSVNYTNPMDR